jgi:aminopeptidase N
MNKFKSWFNIISLIIFWNHSALIAQSYRDSTNILQYDIQLRITDFSSKRINGQTTLHILRNRAEGPVKLDLLGLTVDSLKSCGGILSFNQMGPILSFIPAASSGDTLTVTVYYQGIPSQDERWGGFYFTSDEAFNYGVGMAAEPPNFGRAWFPCIDNFADRAGYSFEIRVPKGYMAVCNGLLKSTQTFPDNTISWKWKTEQEIPTYLASVAIAPYDSIVYTYQSGTKKIPVTIYDRKENLDRASRSLANLPIWMEVFEKQFGPYRWERIGFVMVPFRGGAMEHATNITLSRSTVNGDLSRETLYAHELSHSWFGNLVTCNSEADMWLNEGWASYAESIMVDGVYGREAFLKNIRQNQKDVLDNTHITDGGYFPVYNLPHALTYSSTIYNKGALVVHNLRGLVGDSIFFMAVKKYLNKYAFTTCSVKEFQLFFEETTGLDLSSFFDFWVYGPGFNEVSVDSFYAKKENDSYTTQVTLSQKLLAAEKYERKIATELLLVGNNLEKQLERVEFGNKGGIVNLKTSFKPVLIIEDPGERRIDAVIQDTIDISEGAGNRQTDCSFVFSYQKQKNRGLLLVEQLRIFPGHSGSEGTLKSVDGKYWKISTAGSIPVKCHSIFFSEQSVKSKNYILLYRKTVENEWQSIPFEIIPIQDSRLGFSIDKLESGFYAIGVQKEFMK